MGFSLDIPKKEEIQKIVEEETSLDQETELIISDASKQKGDEIIHTDISDFSKRKELATAIEEFGNDIVKQSSTKNSLMKKRIGELSRVGGEGGVVAKGLEELSIQMKDLDPSGIDFTKTGPLSRLFSPVKAYFNKYKQADAVIAEIIESLEKGAKTVNYPDSKESGLVKVLVD